VLLFRYVLIYLESGFWANMKTGSHN